MNNFIKKYYWLLYLIIIIFIIYPWLKDGYILGLDFVIGPKIKIPTEFYYDYFWKYLLYLVNFLLPTQLIEKLIIILIFFFGFLGGYHLIESKYYWIKFLNGLFFVINPFVYSRLGLTQFNFLLAYSLFPWFIKYLLLFFNNKYRFNHLIKLILSFIFILIIYPRCGLIILLIIPIFILLFLMKNWNRITTFLKSILLATFFVIIAVSFCKPLILHIANLNSNISSLFNVDNSHLKNFQTLSDNKMGLFYNTAALYGFWGDNQYKYLELKQMMPLWCIVIIPYWIAVIYGIFISVKSKQRWTSYLFILILFFSFIITISSTNKYLSNVFDYLIKNNLFFISLREPQKYLSLIIISYIFFSSYGMEAIFNKIKKNNLKSNTFIILVLIFPIIYTPGIFFGMCSQLKITDYPKNWYSLNDELNDGINNNILFLPWHQYLPLSFNYNKTTLNPAPYFFDKITYAGDNIEIGEIKSQSNDNNSQFINGLLNNKNIIDMGNELKNKLNIEYIILAKEADWERYNYLDYQIDLKLIDDNLNYKLYENLK